MNNSLLALAFLAASGSVAASVSNGRITAMSGAGFSTSDFADGVLLNPSLGAAHYRSDDFALVLNAGVKGADEEDLVGGLEELVDYLDYLNELDVQDLEMDMADELKAHLQEVDGKAAQMTAGGSLVAAVPGKWLSAALVVKTGAEANVLSLVDGNDYEMIENSLNQPFDAEDLASSVNIRGAMVTEVGLALSKAIYRHDSIRWLVGVTPKRVTVETFIYSTTVEGFDEDELEAERYTIESSATSFDVGTTYIAGSLRYGFVVRDVISNEFDTVVPEEMFSTKTQSTASLGYKNNWFTAEAAVDLNAAPSFALGADTRLLRAGIEFNAWHLFQLRAGMQQDLEGSVEDTYSVGLGFSPFDTVNVDVAGVMGDNETYGAAAQVGVRF